MPRHTAVLTYSMLENPSKEGKMGVFIHFTVLKDVGDTMNLSALPISWIKKMSIVQLNFFFFPLHEEVKLGSFLSARRRTDQHRETYLT